ncbi:MULTISPECIES: hypothetical protein [unclassified Streptomyces]|uniref:hypothetical protein n=1 Tax=unclassified Streptomyces TaxID=2593676 RepID=UPI000452EA4F|nr:hypothetical protein [Streptomyces sp. PCS3-D2]WKV72691.1 hypothetical protein AW27_014845 [Streptomyces sp. PCS3-D2]
MSEQYALPEAPADLAPGPATEAQHAWIAGYEPGNPWQSKLCLSTPQGTVSYPLTPHTMPELLEGLVLVAQAQQGTAGTTAPADTPEGEPDGAVEEAPSTSLHDGRAARMTGWAVVHDLWERGDTSVRFIMGAAVIGLLVLGIVLS